MVEFDVVVCHLSFEPTKGVEGFFYEPRLSKSEVFPLRWIFIHEFVSETHHELHRAWDLYVRQMCC